PPPPATAEGDETLPSGTVYVPLVRDGDVWKGREVTADRPDKGPFLKCDSDSWQLRCGIESYFVAQDRATAIEESVRSGTATARVRIDGQGNAALMGLTITP
ncbi:MAG: GDYXXLXY domain-containing protein, partial [Aeromicrobium sp.]